MDDTASELLAASARRLDAPGGATDLLGRACRAAGLVLLDHRLRSVHQRVGRSVSHVFEARLGTDDGELDALLVAHADVRPMPGGAFVVDDTAAPIAVWRFPNDPYLTGLPSAIDLDRVGELLERSGVVPEGLRLRTRSYRPSRRAVVEVSVQGTGGGSMRPVLYLKVLTGRAAVPLADRHRALAAHLPVPVVAGVAAELGIVALAALPGRTLRDLVLEGGSGVEPDALLDVSRRLARSGLVSDRAPRAFADPGRHVGLLRSLAPESSATIERVADEAARVEGAPVVVHGDLHAGQLLVAGGAVTGLLDVDGAGEGLLAHDAGVLVASLQVLGELRADRRDHCEERAALVADVYRAEVGRGALARATAGAWLALATTAQMAQGEGWEDTLRGRIRRAAAELRGAGRAVQ